MVKDFDRGVKIQNIFVFEVCVLTPVPALTLVCARRLKPLKSLTAVLRDEVVGRPGYTVLSR
jgi:hypothetical protein